MYGVPGAGAIGPRTMAACAVGGGARRGRRRPLFPTRAATKAARPAYETWPNFPRQSTQDADYKKIGGYEHCVNEAAPVSLCKHRDKILE